MLPKIQDFTQTGQIIIKWTQKCDTNGVMDLDTAMQQNFLYNDTTWQTDPNLEKAIVQNPFLLAIQPVITYFMVSCNYGHFMPVA